MIVEIAIVPGKSAFGLDQLRRSYKTDTDAEATVLSGLTIGTADGDFPFMFLVRVDISETAERATQVDLTFQGCFHDDGSGNPILPDQKHDIEDSVQSASSSMTKAGILLTSPFTLQYYAPSSTLDYFSFGGPGTDIAADPAADPRPITVTCGDTSFLIGPLIQQEINSLFTILLTNTFKATEIVPGQFWQNESRKTKVYSPWLFGLGGGSILLLYSAGNLYHVGDVLTITSGSETATVVVDYVGGVLGGSGIVNWHVTHNTFTIAENIIPATGGFGNGAGFNVIIIRPGISIYDAGSGYTAGDILTVTSGAESATISVTQVIGSGVLWLLNITANTFTTAHTALSATGGTGSGASFSVFI